MIIIIIENVRFQVVCSITLKCVSLPTVHYHSQWLRLGSVLERGITVVKKISCLSKNIVNMVKDIL